MNTPHSVRNAASSVVLFFWAGHDPQSAEGTHRRTSEWPCLLYLLISIIKSTSHLILFCVNSSSSLSPARTEKDLLLFFNRIKTHDKLINYN